MSDLNYDALEKQLMAAERRNEGMGASAADIAAVIDEIRAAAKVGDTSILERYALAMLSAAPPETAEQRAEAELERMAR